MDDQLLQPSQLLERIKDTRTQFNLKAAVQDILKDDAHRRQYLVKLSDQADKLIRFGESLTTENKQTGDRIRKLKTVRADLAKTSQEVIETFTETKKSREKECSDMRAKISDKKEEVNQLKAQITRLKEESAKRLREIEIETKPHLIFHQLFNGLKISPEKLALHSHNDPKEAWELVETVMRVSEKRYIPDSSIQKLRSIKKPKHEPEETKANAANGGQE